MARMKRKWHPKGYYHIVMRGNNRQNIFVDEVDMNEYMRILTYVYYIYKFDILAYCIMTNHVHLLLRSPEVHLGTLMGRINKRYSDYYRTRHCFTGQIYQNRYFAKEILEPNGLLRVSAYIHLNPIATKVPMVEKLEDYPHSTFPNYFNNTSSAHPFLKLNLLPKYHSESQQINQTYAKWCLEEQE